MVYKAAAKVLHPDKGGDPEEFKKLEKAWRIVTEVQKANAAGNSEVQPKGSETV
jgi:curved DNA-binding protein CbpA